MIFLGHIFQLLEYLPTKKMWVKEETGQKIKETIFIPRTGVMLLPVYPNFAHMAKYLHQLISLTNVKKSKSNEKDVITFNSTEKIKGY